MKTRSPVHTMLHFAMDAQYETVVEIIREDTRTLAAGAPPHIISIDGNIGSGKTTLFRHLKDVFQHDHAVVFVEEPVELWDTTIVDQKSLLGHYYSDPIKYAFAFQMFVSVTRFQSFEKQFKTAADCVKVMVVERTLMTDKYVFESMLHDMQHINDVEHRVYESYHMHFSDVYTIHRLFYIRTTPETCLTRIHTRKRESEKKIEHEYLVRCDEYHEYFVNQMEAVNVHIHVIDGELERYP